MNQTETATQSEPVVLAPESAPAEPASVRSEEVSAEPSFTAPAGAEIEAYRLDADAVRVVARLRQTGYEAYLVGGCVRDLLVGHSPKDFDIATSATPNQVRSLFRNSRLIGRRFRLAHVYFKGGKILEVSTFRANPVEAEEPSAVGDAPDAEDLEASQIEPLAEADTQETAAPVLTAPEAPAEKDLLITEDNTFGTPVEDALRRDFTINGLFYSPLEGKVIDHVNGLRDLAAQEIRTIGDPEKRLREDPVRILRAIRFASKLAFDIEARTYAAMEGAVEDLPRCSAPMLLEETFRLIRGGHTAPTLNLLMALDALKYLLSPVDAFLKASDAEGQAEYLAHIRAMDSMISEGVMFDDAMLLAAVLLPIALDEPELPVDPNANPAEAERPPSVAKAVEALLQELVQKARLPRRIAERCRMILNSQRTLAGLRRLRGGMLRQRSHPLFAESLKIFEVWVRATGEHKDALTAWKSGSAPNPVPGADGPRRNRSRRRGRKGPGGGGNAGPRGEANGGAPDNAAPAAPAPSGNPS